MTITGNPDNPYATIAQLIQDYASQRAGEFKMTKRIQDAIDLAWMITTWGRRPNARDSHELYTIWQELYFQLETNPSTDY